MHLLIFGCGYLGQRVGVKFLEHGHTVSAVTRSADRAQIFQQFGIQPIVGDICEPAMLANLPSVDAVLFSVSFDRTSTRTKHEVVYDGLANVLEAVDGRCRQFIYTSSTSVYGQATGEWVDEESETKPDQLAGQLMLSTEELIRDRRWKDSRTHSTILRLAGIYGPDRMLTRIDSLKAGTPFAGRGDSWLNLIHVDDAAEAVRLCATKSTTSDSPRVETCNIVDDQPITRGDFYSRLAKLVNAPAPIFDQSRPSERGSGGLNKRCSNTRFRSRWNWFPGYPSVETGLPASLDASAIRSNVPTE